MFRPTLALATLTLTLAAQEPAIQESTLRAHLSFLADDLMEGRGPGQRGGQLATRYLETQLQALGLKPAFGESFRQMVPMVGIQARPDQSSLRFQGPAGDLDLAWNRDFLLTSGAAVADLPVDAQLVFVGHGADLDAWDDFKGVDVRGKILLALVGSRPGDTSLPGSPARFTGRWGYKIAEARRRGAAGILLIHTTDQAGYDWSVVRTGWTGERVHLDPAPSGASLQGWLTAEGASRLLRASGQDFQALCRAASTRDFRPVPLQVRLVGHLSSTVRRFQDANVAGLLPGTDPALGQEIVVYSAHWDHLGLDPRTGAIYRGAVDNASGCAGVLAIAQALGRLPGRRSQLFFFPCGEESGLLGAEAFLARNPEFRARVVADLNLESLNFAGPTRDIGLDGAETSTLLEAALRTAQEMGLRATPPGADLSGLRFRADHFAFVKAGIPAFSPGFSLDGEWDYQNPAHGLNAKSFVSKAYHQPLDAYHPNWDLRGMVQQVEFTLLLGRRLADQPQKPQWKGQPPSFQKVSEP